MILLCFGTRPEWLKIKPVIEELKNNKLPYKTLFTGQHVDIVTRNADLKFVIKKSTNNRLNDITSSLLRIPDNFFKGIEYVLVQGDTTSAAALALNAFHRGIKVIHLEAGLRTYDSLNPYPEELNRQIISRIATIHLCPTKNNKKNLLLEKCHGKIYVTGNTSLDNLKNIKTSYSNNILVTLHRRENHIIMADWFKQLNHIASLYKDLNFILPLHPNPNVQKYKNLLTNINIVKPLNHQQLLQILSNSRFCITDSGGIQEEASFLNKKAIVCRKITERQEAIGITSFMCPTPKHLLPIFKKIYNDYKIKTQSPFGNGNAAKKIIKIFKKDVYNR